MLGGIISRLTGAGRRRPAAGPGGPATRGRPPAGGATRGGANRDIERGARSLLRGLRRRR